MIFVNCLIAALVGALLYRLRGGWIKTLLNTNSTHLARAVWAVPTGAFVYLLAPVNDWWLIPSLVASFFASMALLGHGAHMIYGKAYFDIFANPNVNRLEMATSWWLPDVFGGSPIKDWTDQWLTDLYNMAGMSFIGVVRNLIAVLPLVMIAPLACGLYVATGLLHGPLYFLGWKFTPDIRAPELLVGGVSWLSLFLLFKVL